MIHKSFNQFFRRSFSSASIDGTIHIWDVSEGTCLHSLNRVHHRTIKTLAFSPDGVMLASGGYDNLINVWKFKVRFVRDSKKISKLQKLRINSAGAGH